MTIQTSKYPCGFCTTDTHEYCPGAIYNGDQVTILICPCGCEQSLKLRCLLCGNRTSDEINPDRRVCEDTLTCVVEYNRKRTMTYERLYPKSKTAMAKPNGKDCNCSCGEKTNGGKFKPGHADKLVKNLAGEIKSGQITEDQAREHLVGISEGLLKKLEVRL
jgi:hypothetical protein